MAREWPVVMRQLWTDSRWVNSSEDVETAVDGLQASFGDRYMPDNAELVATLRWMADGREWSQKKGPSLRELMVAVRVRRKKADAPDGSDGKPISCGLCSPTGWLTLREKGRESSVPCICPAGERWMKVCQDYRDMTYAQKEAFDGLRRQALEQAKGGEL